MKIDLKIINVDTVATKRMENVDLINRYLTFDNYKLIIENNSCYLKKDNDIYDYYNEGAFSKIYFNKEKLLLYKKLMEKYYTAPGVVSRFG